MERTSFIWMEIFCYIINVFTGTFSQLNAALLDKLVN